MWLKFLPIWLRSLPWYVPWSTVCTISESGERDPPLSHCSPRSLPSWRTLQPSADGKELDGKVCSEREMRALNSKEAVILITNLSADETLIPQQEIITDVTQMRTVANVHESGEWGGE